MRQFRHASSGSKRNFGRDIIPRLIQPARVFAYLARDAISGGQAYWRDVGTIDCFWASNLELLEAEPPFDISDKEWPILTHQLQLPTAKFMTDYEGRSGTARDSMLSVACIIDGGIIDAVCAVLQCTCRDRSTSGRHRCAA